MSSKLARKASVSLIKTVPSLIAKRLEKAGLRVANQSGTDIIEYEVSGGDGGGDGTVIDIVSHLIVEACGSTKGVMKRPEGDIVVDTQAAVKRVPFTTATRSIDIKFDTLPNQSGVAAIAEMTYNRCIRKELPNAAAVVTDFPACLCQGGHRFDYVIAGLVVLSYVGEAGKATVRANVRAIDTLMGRMCSQDFVQSVLPEKWQHLEAMDSDQLADALDEAQQRIADYWSEQEEHTDRVKANAAFLMTAVGSDLRNCFRLLTEKSGGVVRCPRKVVEAARYAIDDWMSACEKLTNISWRGEWGKAGAFVDAAMQRTRERLDTVSALRALHDEITDLLDAQDLRALRGDTLWSAFEGVDLFDASPASDPKWENAVAAFYRRLEPIEHRCAAELRDFFAERISLSPQAILGEVAQYKRLLKRPVIGKELAAERDTLLAKLSERVQNIRIEYERRHSSLESEEQLREDRRQQAGRYMPGVVNKVVWIRQLRGRIGQMIEMAATMLSDLARHQAFKESASELLVNLQEYESDTFKNWVLDIKDQEQELTLNAKAAVISFNTQNKMEVNYRERLVQLLREERMFTAMGFTVPVEIQKMCQQAMKYYQNGVALKQLATIYNTMGEEIIRSTITMLEGPARKFEDLIGGGGKLGVTWGNKDQTDRFITSLREASNALTNDNRLLHRVHNEIATIVLDLFKIDLLRSKDRWMGRVRSIRDKIVRCEFRNTEPWVKHWDMQIYKALEHQYQLGLESLHEVLPEIRADVIFDAKSGRACLRPPLEQLRDTYYTKLRDFVTFPTRFRGINGTEDEFRRIANTNERGITAVMQHSQQLFRRVEKTIKRFQPMLIIGQCGQRGAPALEDIVAALLSDAHDWEANVRLLKQKGKEIGAVDMFVKVDCITLSTAGIKAAVEEQLSQLADALNATLRRSAEGHLKKIDAFLDEALNVLNAQFTKLEDLTKAASAQAQLHEQRTKYSIEFSLFDAKNKLLMSMTSTKGIAYRETKDRWDTFVERLDKYEEEMSKQLDAMKQSVDTALTAFRSTLETFTAHWNERKPKDPKSEGAVAYITERKQTFAGLKEKAADLKAQCHYFQLDEPDFSTMDELDEDLKNYEGMWAIMNEFQTQAKVLRDENWITFRTKIFKFEDFVKGWQDSLRTSEFASTPIGLHLRETADAWLRVVPVLKFVRGDGMTPNHWAEMFRLINIDRATTADSLLFGTLLDNAQDILAKEKQLKALHARAQGEAQIREALDDIRAWSQSAEFKLVPHQERKGVMLITEWKDVLTAVNDNQALLFSLKDSPYFKPFAEDAQQWEVRLARADAYLQFMNQIQRKWVYLEPIFARGALPQEQQRFERTDREYLSIMAGVAKDPKVISLTQHADYKEKLKAILEQLERCQKALNEFLEEKRDKFPRFYFISDDDLLEILGQSRNVNVIQSHLKKLFMGIHAVRFDRAQKHIEEICSLEGEVVKLLKPVEIKVEVEDWLNDLDVEMKRTLKQSLVSCVNELEVSKYASQILCACEQVHFTRKTEEAMQADQSKGGLRAHRASLQQQLKDLTGFSAANTDEVLGLKVRALIMDLIHSIEVVDLLIKENVTSLDSWLWRKQLRYYLNKDGECVIRMVDAEFKYTYEYQGNAPKLVHTPLTDKCYLTLTQGMQLGYGGNPYGPAGTGKTESVKALGNAMGRQVLVFNCDEGIDFKSMGRIFTGLVKCGAWGCFDEFNRLKVDQLSAVSQMIQVIQEALKQGDERCILLSRDIEVNPNAGIFVTLNPAGKGYGGRSKLPDNLKQLFRAVAMSAPDNQLITETILFSEGFEFASELATKVITVFRLSKQLLSEQQHYDWGLRALKAVLRLGGVLVHQYLKEKLTNSTTHTPEEVMANESEIIIKSLRVNTLSKLTFDDVKLFNGLINDVFPGVAIREIKYEDLKPAILEAITELKLLHIETQVDKILQLYEAMNQRMGVILVGPSGSGKSTLLKILRKALQRLKVTVPLYPMNPKAMPREQLLGRMDLDTREWYDGVLTEAAKKVVREEQSVRSWIFCDGDVDPEWVESLNSVLDDNKLLTLPNGVRIQFGSNVNFVFETHSLQFASPATVSRTGMIFLSEEDVDVKTTVQSWLSEQPAEIATLLKPWMEEFFYKAISALLATKALIVETTRMGIVKSGLSQLGDCNNKAQFAIGLVRGLGSYLPDTARLEYARDIYHMTGVRPPDPKNPLDCTYDPNRQALVSHHYEASFDLSVEDLKGYPMIQTVEVQRHLATLAAWVKGPNYRPFILVGPEGCGKTMLLRNCFADVPGVRVAVVNCSAQTTANHVIQKLQQTCQVFSTNQGRVLRPKEADRLVLVLKDLNLPKPDKYNTVMLHSFLQQLVLYQGYYDAGDLEWVGVERVQIVASMNPPGSMGRYPVASRFIAIVSVLSVSYPSQSSLETIYSDFFTAMLQSPAFQAMPLGVNAKSAADFARAVTNVYGGVTKRFTVDDASHYIFSPRDITRWLLGVMAYNPDGADLMQLLYYEGMRIFADRLVTNDDRRKFEKLIADAFASLGWQKGEADQRAFSTWLDTSGQKRLAVAKMDDVKKTAEMARTLYVRENYDLDLQLVPEVLSWMTRVDRVLARDGGSALLVGRTGTGAPEIVKLCAAQLKMPLFTLNVTRSYSLKNFSIDVKAAMNTAGVEGQHCVLFLEDFHFYDSAFLERINSLLSAGEIPGLYAQEELDAMLGPLKEEALSEGFIEGVYSYFVHRVARYLHVMIVMDPSNSEYELRCRSNPALFTRCNVCWLGKWTTESMKLVPRMIMKDVFRSLEAREGADKEWGLHRELVKLHDSAGPRFAPQHFKTLVSNYRTIYDVKNSASTEVLSKLKSGLDKLAEAEIAVDTISKEVTEKKKIMEVKQREADDALVQIQQKMEEASEQKSKIRALQKDVDAETKTVNERASVIETQLAGIQPTLDAAKEAVGQIDNRHLTELKSLKTPPAAVQDVLEGVLTLLGASDLSWNGMRKWLQTEGVRAILSLNPESIRPDTRDACKRILAQKGNSFKTEVIERASKAAAPMAPWLKANIEYSEVVERIQPMRDELKKYEENLQQLNDKVKKYEDKVRKVDQKIDELKKNFGNKTKEAEVLKDKLEQAEATLTAAQDLLSKLGGEKTRWGKLVGTLKAEEKTMPKRALLAAGFITYLGCEPEDERAKIVRGWAESQGVGDFNYFTFMRTEATMLLYKSQGLPADGLSMENAVSILDQTRVPLIVDPANQALEWLKNHLKTKEVNVEVCTPADERFGNALELAVRFGKTLLITEVDKIEPILYPLIRKELMTDGPKKTVQIGDKTVDYADNFQLFLLTRSSALRIPPDVAAHLTEISFTITRGGLEGQLLGVTIQKEQPELEQQKVELLKQEESLKLQLEELENTLLRNLAQSKGSLLDNKELIESLNQLKTQAQSIEDALQKSKQLSVDLDAKREVYRPLAAKGSAAFFLIKDLRNLSHMYQFSLTMFLSLFRRALAEGEGDTSDAAYKIQNLSQRLVALVVQSVSRALFKDDRVTFGVHMARALTVDCCTDAQWKYFVNKSVATDTEPVPMWVPKDSTDSFRQLRAACPEVMQRLQKLEREQQNETDHWYDWLNAPAPETKYPAFLLKLSPFERLLIVKALRDDRLIAAMNLWACDALGVPSLSEATTIAGLLPSTTAAEPIILLTTPGADPSVELQNAAHEHIGKAKFHQVAMGGGQQEEAMNLLRRCSQNGEWLCLKNLHLVIPWVSVLEQELNLLTSHKDFRLWLTSEAHDEFPSILLSNALKVTFEAPPGVKQNLLRTYNFWSGDFLAKKTPAQAQLLFALAFLHAILQERRTYIPQGWTKFYEFSQADIRSAADVLIAQSKDSKIDWRTIHGVLENAIYGGRMESDFDVRVLRQYFDRLMTAKVLSIGSQQAEPIKPGLRLPASNNRKDYLQIVNTEFAESDIPALFALPPNADRTVQRTKVLAVANSLVRLVEATRAGTMSREQWGIALQPLLDLWLKLCQPHAELLTMSLGRRDARPVEGFVHAETEASLSLVAKVEETMSSLRKVIDGTMLLSEALRAEATALLAGEVPLAWDGRFSGPEAILPWLRVLVRKAVAIRKWNELAHAGTLLKQNCNLADLFRPMTFLDALRQETARHTREPLVSLRLVSSIGAPPPGAAIPVVLRGMYVQGATLSGEFLDEIDNPDAPIVSDLPDVHVAWVPAAQSQKVETTVGIPVYTNLMKDTFLLELQFKCRSSADAPKFILAGTAVVLEV
jgi:dynein heavy chain 2